MTTAADIVNKNIERWLTKVLADRKGHEDEALIEIIRSADLHSVLLILGNTVGPAPFGVPRGYSDMIQNGIVVMLDAFLSEMRNDIDLTELLKGRRGAGLWADETLERAGALSKIRQLTEMERFKSVSCEIRSHQHIEIFIKEVDLARVEKEEEYAVLDHIREQHEEKRNQLNIEIAKWIESPIDEYCTFHETYIKEVKFNGELFNVYLQLCELQVNEYAESDLFPDGVMIGGRKFGEWKKIASALAAYSSMQLFYATKAWKSLPAQMQGLQSLRNLQTQVLTKGELGEKWDCALQFAGIAPVDSIDRIAAMTKDDAKQYAANNEPISPLAISMGDYAVIPHFGYQGNPFSLIANNLEKHFSKEWGLAKHDREAGFQSELRDLYHSENYIFGDDNVKIHRENGEEITDIDSAVYESSENCIYLIQLKWLASYITPKQRKGRIKKLLEANDWIEKLLTWSAEIDNALLIEKLGIKGATGDTSKMTVRLMVLNRGWTRIGKHINQDERAAWVSWSRLRYLHLTNITRSDPLNAAWLTVKEGNNQEFRPTGQSESYQFDDLKVIVHY